MKVRPRCSVCLLQRAFNEIQLATDDPLLQFQVLQAVINLFAEEFNENAISAVLGTKRDRIIRKMTNCPDPYKELKHKSNELALKLSRPLEQSLNAEKDPYKRFRSATLAAIVGNILEFDIIEHSIDLENVDYLKDLLLEAEHDLAIDHIREIYTLVQSVNQVLFLTDNAGEIIFDKFLIMELLNLGSHVLVAVKGSPALNDATWEDAEFAGLITLSQKNSNLNIITTGSDHVGLYYAEISEHFHYALEHSKMIIAKGMGYYETLPESSLQKPIAHLFRTKCSAVAQDVGVQLGQNVALLRSNTR
ncbi:MAG TPA: ARMT1-like domain-containing protein [Candidatus Deferrimicrobium sp.]|nr:ARMT1-like domain-containing protein [Candidatus Deferrimicrobium sp.]